MQIQNTRGVHTQKGRRPLPSAILAPRAPPLPSFLPPTNQPQGSRPPIYRASEQDGEGEVVEAVARAAGAAAERRARAALQAREIPRPGGLLGQGTRVGGRPVFFLLLLLALLLLEQVVISLSLALQGPTAGRGALDPAGAGAPVRPALGGRPPPRRRLDRAVSSPQTHVRGRV
jgi:hypothetical protein